MSELTRIEMARKVINMVTRAEINLKYRVMAAEELNVILNQRMADFDKQLQEGTIPTLALKLVTGDSVDDPA